MPTKIGSKEYWLLKYEDRFITFGSFGGEMWLETDFKKRERQLETNVIIW